MVRIALVSYVVLIALAPMYGDNWDSFHPLVRPKKEVNCCCCLTSPLIARIKLCNVRLLQALVQLPLRVE